MTRRLTFLLITAFWITMNVWLYDSEFGGGKMVASRVPADLVWQKILTAPDNSTMDILREGQKIGYCRWAPNVGEELATGKVSSEELPLEGMVRQPSGYTIELEGNVMISTATNRLRWILHLALSTNGLWREISLNAVVRPRSWHIAASAARRALDFKLTSDGEVWERTFGFDELAQPEKWLKEFGLSPSLALLGLGWSTGTGLKVNGSASPPPADLDQLKLGLKWEARNDVLRMGHSPVRVYRLETKVLDRYRFTVTVSRVGEILRVELPNGLILMNDSLLGW